MEYSPPPFFKQGPSAFARLLFFSIFAITLLVADARFNALVPIRRVVAFALYPLQRAVLVPGDVLTDIGGYFDSLEKLRHANEGLQRTNLAIAQKALLEDQMQAENAQLRKLLAERDRVAVKTIASEVLYDARDPFARKIVLDRGASDGVQLGSPVIDDAGVVGQVTRLFANLSEVTLLTDKDQTIPVQNLRSGVRAVAYGGVEGGYLDLRFMASNADIQKGDVLVTSGLDGVYPPGLPVARVERNERNAAYAFARILCVPIGGVERHRHVLIVLPEKLAPPPPPAEPLPDAKHAKKAKN
jgi:rod shape-determining protein MreC